MLVDDRVPDFVNLVGVRYHNDFREAELTAEPCHVLVGFLCEHLSGILLRDVLLLRLAGNLVRPVVLIDQEKLLMKLTCQELGVKVKRLDSTLASLFFLSEGKDICLNKTDHGFISCLLYNRNDVTFFVGVNDWLCLDHLCEKEQGLVNRVYGQSLRLRFCLIEEDAKVIECDLLRVDTRISDELLEL